MNQTVVVKIFGKVTARRTLVALIVATVAAGVVVALVSDAAMPPSSAPSASANVSDVILNSIQGLDKGITFGAVSSSGGDSYGNGQTLVVSQGGTSSVSTTTTEVSYSTTTENGPVPSGNGTQGSPSGSIEFSSQVTLQSASPQSAASSIAALAYSVGGYVAYQSTYSSSANLVIRVPASAYQSVLSQVQTFGKVESLTSNSNDVSVQYTDLNATLLSLQTEQGALLRLLNESTSVNSTLAIESQLQGVNQQINEVESQILQTRTLIAYSTIDVAVSLSLAPAALSLALTATPKSGEAPLSVTFNAVVNGGDQPYVVNYNFGDGTASQGQIVIHTYNQPGDYNVTVTATDQNGTTAEQSTMVRVAAAPGRSGFQSFAGTVSALFVSVVEGIAEVAVVVLPIAAVGAVVVVPLQRRSRSQKAKPE